jgi:hypothetical protein
MKIPGRIVSVTSALVAFLLLTSLSSRAQVRTSPTVAAHPVVQSIRVRPSATHGVAVPRSRVNTAVAPSAHARAFIRRSNAFGETFAVGAGETLQQLLDPVPGPGFNYAHVAAIDRDLAIKAVIDPETQWRIAIAERVLRDTGGLATPGYYLLGGGGEYVMPAASSTQEEPQPSQPPTIVVLQQPAPQSALVSVPAVAPQPSAPIPDVGSFTLVLQSGKKIQAIALMRSGDRIVYITADGERHTIPASELDSAATQRVNEESGTQLRL